VKGGHRVVEDAVCKGDEGGRVGSFQVAQLPEQQSKSRFKLKKEENNRAKAVSS